jgi:hypothetical protein
MTVATRVLDELRRCNVPLDDDQLTKRLGVSQRQQINQVCRRLEAEGRLRRYIGADGKIVNDARRFEDEAQLSETPPETPPGDGRTEAERADGARRSPDRPRNAGTSPEAAHPLSRRPRSWTADARCACFGHEVSRRSARLLIIRSRHA